MCRLSCTNFRKLSPKFWILYEFDGWLEHGHEMRYEKTFVSLNRTLLKSGSWVTDAKLYKFSHGSLISDRSWKFTSRHFLYWKLFFGFFRGLFEDYVFWNFFTFFYISRRKYWFRANFRFPVFDGFTRFGMSWTRFHYFWKISFCLCVSVYMTKMLWQL